MPFCVECNASISEPAVAALDACRCGAPMAKAVPGSRQPRPEMALPAPVPAKPKPPKRKKATRKRSRKR